MYCSPERALVFSLAGCHQCPRGFFGASEELWVSLVQRGRVQMKPCNNPSFTGDSLCGKYEVFENRSAQTGRRISLNIVLLPAATLKPAPDPLFYLAGGPGGAATVYASESFMNGLRRNRDVVLVDQRGTGESNPLNCPSAAGRDD